MNVTPFLTVKSDYKLSSRRYITLFGTVKDGQGFILLLYTYVNICLMFFSVTDQSQYVGMCIFVNKGKFLRAWNLYLYPTWFFQRDIVLRNCYAFIIQFVRKNIPELLHVDGVFLLKFRTNLYLIEVGVIQKKESSCALTLDLGSWFALFNFQDSN